MNNEVLEIPGKINIDMREVIKAINKKEHDFSIQLYDNAIGDPYNLILKVKDDGNHDTHRSMGSCLRTTELKPKDLKHRI